MYHAVIVLSVVIATGPACELVLWLLRCDAQLTSCNMLLCQQLLGMVMSPQSCLLFSSCKGLWLLIVVISVANSFGAVPPLCLWRQGDCPSGMSCDSMGI